MTYQLTKWMHEWMNNRQTDWSNEWMNEESKEKKGEWWNEEGKEVRKKGKMNKWMKNWMYDLVSQLLSCYFFFLFQGISI